MSLSNLNIRPKSDQRVIYGSTRFPFEKPVFQKSCLVFENATSDEQSSLRREEIHRLIPSVVREGTFPLWQLRNDRVSSEQDELVLLGLKRVTHVHVLASGN